MSVTFFADARNPTVEPVEFGYPSTRAMLNAAGVEYDEYSCRGWIEAKELYDKLKSCMENINLIDYVPPNIPGLRSKEDIEKRFLVLLKWVENAISSGAYGIQWY